MDGLHWPGPQPELQTACGGTRGESHRAENENDPATGAELACIAAGSCVAESDGRPPLLGDFLPCSNFWFKSKSATTTIKYVVPVDAENETAAAEAALTELQTRLAALSLAIPTAGSVIKVAPGHGLVASPYEVPAAVWGDW